VADVIASLKLCPLLHTPEFSRKADRLLVNILGGADLTLPKVNELMTAIAEQFGRDSHIIMGAVIDEDMASRVEVCVIGTSDMGGRGMPPRRPAPPSARHKANVPGAAVPRGETPAAHVPTNVPKGVAEPEPMHARADTKGLHGQKPAQDEFGFGEVESRGHFEKTDRNLFDGQDLDVPTYLRKGIKILL
jgi:cell division protein FtsZ